MSCQETSVGCGQLTIHLRGLETLGVNAQQYGSLFTPIVMSKLPSDIRLTVARKRNGTVWALKKRIEILKVAPYGCRVDLYRSVWSFATGKCFEMNNT